MLAIYIYIYRAAKEKKKYVMPPIILPYIVVDVEISNVLLFISFVSMNFILFSHFVLWRICDQNQFLMNRNQFVKISA
jgi:hypothetical protein